MKQPKHAKIVARPAHKARKIILVCIATVAAALIAFCIGLGLLVDAGMQSLRSDERDASYAHMVELGDRTYVLNPNISSILFIGMDKDNGRATPPYNGQADAIMLLVLDEDTGKITCLAISRSSWIPILKRDFESGLIEQTVNYLCLGYDYGYDDANSSELISRDVSNLLNGIPINSYCTLNMSGIGALADAVGGVSLTALSDVTKTDIKAGEQLDLFGDQARDYVWQRDESDDYSSAERLERQEQFAKAFAKKVLEECKANPLKLFELFDVAEEHSVTNLEFPELAYLASFIARHGVSDINVIALPGDYVPIEGQPTRFEVDDMQLIQMVVDIFYTEVQ